MKKNILCLLFVMMACYGWSQQYRYVKAGATGNGTSWSNASGDLQAMINASAAGDEVWVAEGTYQPAAGQWFSMKEGVKIYGGFPANNDNAALDQRNWALHPTILKGNGNSVIRNVFTKNTKMTNASLLDGFTIREGKLSGGYGAGVYNAFASPSLSNLIITANRAGTGGGGIANIDSSPIIINTVVFNNSGANGTEMFNRGADSKPISINVTFANSLSPNGSTLKSDKNAVLTIRNSVVYGGMTSITNLTGATYQAYNSYIKLITSADGNGNIDGSLNPLFIDFSSSDFIPSAQSPLVDAGKNSYYNGSIVDIVGDPRIQGPRIDIGAFEFQGGVSCTEVVWNGSTWSGPTGIDKHLIINGNLTLTSDLEGCSMKINSGSVIVPIGRNLRLLNELNIIGGSFRVDYRGGLVQVNDVVNMGDIQVKVTTKPMDKSNHGYWSSPVAGYKMSQFSPNTPINSYYSWNLSDQTWTTQAGGDVVMQPGHGYLMRAPMSNTPVVYNMSFNGIPNNGEVTRAIQGGGKWNYLGNPYPSAINIDAFLYDPANSGLDKLVYLWTNGYQKEGGNYVYQWEGFATYNAVGAVGTPATHPTSSQTSQMPTKYIATGQGFFIPGNANGQAVFKNSHRVMGNNNNSFNREKPVDRYWLGLISQDNRYGQTLVGYLEEATNAKDKDIDAPPFLSGQETIELYTLLDQERFIIQGRAPFEQEDVVALGYSLAEAGTYTIKLSGFEGLFVNGQDVYLYDKALQLSHNLKEGDYSFTTEAGVHDDRFEVMYIQREGISPASLDANWVAFNKNGELRIESTADFKHIRIYDLVGRMIYDQSIAPARAYDISGLDQNQILIVKVGFDNQGESTKKIKY